jgi:shikimate 5-dehydrogenase
MAEITLSDLFGAGATQTATELTILKSDLAAVGLTANTSNKAEALLNALFRKAAVVLTAANLDQNADQSIVINNPSLSTDERLSNTYLVQNFTIGFQRLIADGNIVPGDM